MRTDDVHPGDVIGGKYRVRAILSRHPTFVVEAFHVEFDQRVVIKLLLAGTGDDKEIERFRREARTLSKLETEHAARIIDVGTESDGSFYLVRQHVDGEDLASYVQKYGPRPLPEAVLLALQAAECVAETHAHGIVLRELSPANMVVSRRASGTPLVKITDFGTAKLMRDASAPAGNSSLTATALFGLSPYSCPELVRKAKSVDQRADVWSLGAVLYFMLAGKPPFRGDVTHLMLAITREDPAPLTSLRGDLPPDMDNIMAWAMAKDVDRRFKNMRSLAHALAPYAPAEGQVLIERIAQIAHQAKQRKSGSVPAPPPSYVPPPPGARKPPPSVVPPPPSHPVAISDGEEMVGDDEATQVLGGASGSGSNLSSLAREITQGLGPAQALPAMAPPPGFASRGLVVPPPPPSIPPSPFLGNGPKIVPPRGRAPSPSVPESFPFGRFDTLPPPAVQQTQRPPPMVAPSSGFDMRIVWGALAATAVMAPVVLLLLLRDAPKPVVQAANEPQKPLDAQKPDAIDPSRAQPQSPTSRPQQAAVLLTGEPAATAPPVEPTNTVSPPNPRVVATTPTVARTAFVPPTKPDPKKPDPEPKKPDPPEATSGGGNGRLLAIASGGSCAFSVDGAGKGSGSSLSVSLPAGKHSVTCKPTSGSAKSRTVTIKANETSMLTFKL